ncbi:MAG: hypothetical protein ABI594_16625 [Ginsengibacter sp.]
MIIADNPARKRKVWKYIHPDLHHAFKGGKIFSEFLMISLFTAITSKKTESAWLLKSRGLPSQQRLTK